MQMNNPGSTLIDQTTTAPRKDSTIMKSRQVFPLILSVILMASVFSATVKAAPHLPLGHFNGVSSLKWQGGTYGANTTVVLSDPAVGDDSDWGRDMALITSNGNTFVAMGFEKNGAGNVYNHCYGAGLWFFWDWNYSAGKCYSIPETSDYVNRQWVLQMHESADHKTIYFITGKNGGNGLPPCYNVCSYTPPLMQAWYDIRLGEYVDNTFTGHMVWGVNWVNNQWYTGDINAHFQTVPSSCPGNSGCPSAANPPQMFWHTLPADSPIGGELWSCVYDSGTSCTLGS